MCSIDKMLDRNETVSTESMMKICRALHCDIGDIAEFISTKQEDMADGNIQ